MSYFSRLTDIVTCNLTKLLDEAEDPLVTLKQIVHEMEEGLSGAKRSVATAARSEERLIGELEEHRSKIEYWTSNAKEQLTTGNDNDARLALIRKGEVEDLIAGLEQQHQAAVATREHLTTTQRALEARLADARRRQQQLARGEDATAETSASEGKIESDAFVDGTRAKQVEAELESLRRELGQTG